jgi:hypothetical protein
MLDFSKIRVVETNNPREGNAASVKAARKRAPFLLKVNYEKEKLVFSKSLFNELGLAHNSLALAQAGTVEGKVILAVCPGDTGVFHKGKAGRRKGQIITSRTTVEQLTALGQTSGKFNLKHLATDPDTQWQYFQLDEYISTAPVQETAEVQSTNA